MCVFSDLGAAVAGQRLVDLVDVGGDGLEAGVEAVESLLLDLLEGLLGFLGPLPGRLELCRRPISQGSQSVSRASYRVILQCHSHPTTEPTHRHTDTHTLETLAWLQHP